MTEGRLEGENMPAKGSWLRTLRIREAPSGLICKNADMVRIACGDLEPVEVRDFVSILRFAGKGQGSIP